MKVQHFCYPGGKREAIGISLFFVSARVAIFAEDHTVCAIIKETSQVFNWMKLLNAVCYMYMIGYTAELTVVVTYAQY
jgi:hypothetical protein